MNYLKLQGTTKKTIVLNEDTGKSGGFTTEHWDDHVDATVVEPETTLYVHEYGLYFPGYGVLIPGDIAGYRKGKPVPAVAGGAWSVSGLYVLNWIDILDATQLVIDTSLTTQKWAMYNNTETPNYSTETLYSATNEVTGTGYTAGGQAIVSPTTTESPTGTLMYDMADQVWASPTTVTAFGAKLYRTVTSNALIVAMNFNGSFASTAGTFTIQFAATGVFTIDLTP